MRSMRLLAAAAAAGLVCACEVTVKEGDRSVSVRWARSADGKTLSVFLLEPLSTAHSLSVVATQSTRRRTALPFPRVWLQDAVASERLCRER